jgi:hypothetical protein
MAVGWCFSTCPNGRTFPMSGGRTLSTSGNSRDASLSNAITPTPPLSCTIALQQHRSRSRWRQRRPSLSQMAVGWCSSPASSTCANGWNTFPTSPLPILSTSGNSRDTIALQHHRSRTPSLSTSPSFFDEWRPNGSKGTLHFTHFHSMQGGEGEDTHRFFFLINSKPRQI